MPYLTNVRKVFQEMRPYLRDASFALRSYSLPAMVALVGVLVLCSASALSPAAAVAADACSDVPRPFVASIPIIHETAADSLLGSRSVLELTDAQASTLLDVASGPWSLADTMLSHAITKLEQQREAEMDRQQGSWSVRDAEELASLVRLEQQLTRRAPRPFLVRAVRGFEGTGGYRARECGDTLSVFHGSLGRDVPPPTPSTVVVFLAQMPIRVQATYSVIE